jgi:hypothetical protein
MSLELRCPVHPAYEGKVVPSTVASSAQTCADCWELYRMKHEGVESEVIIHRG